MGHSLLSGLKFMFVVLVLGTILSLVFNCCDIPIFGGLTKANAADDMPEPVNAVEFLLAIDNTPSKDPRWAVAQAYEEAIVAAAVEYGHDPALLLAMSYLESSFDLKAVGQIGELGLFQVHGMARRGCDLTTPEGNATCGARWLSRVIAACGGRLVLDLDLCRSKGVVSACGGGLSAYASGSCAASDKVALVVRRRLRMAEKVRPYLSGGEGRLLASSGGQFSN